MLLIGMYDSPYVRRGISEHQSRIQRTAELVVDPNHQRVQITLLQLGAQFVELR
jgi:hypothetical protein